MSNVNVPVSSLKQKIALGLIVICMINIALFFVWRVNHNRAPGSTVGNLVSMPTHPDVACYQNVMYFTTPDKYGYNIPTSVVIDRRTLQPKTC